MKFADLGLSDELLATVTAKGYDTPTPIQAQAIPSVLMMRDLIGIAQTGTGKTASFVLPMIDILAHGRARARMPRSLILEPTRELAAQVAENFEGYGVNHKLSMALLIGGVQMGDQIKALEKGVDVLIATPGRLMDLFERGKILLTGCSMLVIDEADRMLDMGFIPDIENICTKLPANRQTLLFSATMPPPIKKLADRFLSNPKYIEVSRPASSNLNIVQHKVKVQSKHKRELLRHLLRTDNVTTAIVFCNRKTTVRELAKSLKTHHFSAGEIHGDMDQSARNAELQKFKDGTINILVASDVAARGLDVKGVSHVFNFDTPWHPDDYVHRIGRTGRAGATGRAFTFVAPEDAEAISSVEKLTGGAIPEFLIDLDAKTGRVKSGPADKAAEVVAEKVAEQAPVAVADGVAGEPGAGRGRRGGRGRSARPRDEQASDGQAGGAVHAAQSAQQDDVEAPALARDLPENEPVEPARDERPARRERAERVERNEPRAPRRRDPAPVTGTGDWNGPVPEFLGVSALN